MLLTVVIIIFCANIMFALLLLERMYLVEVENISLRYWQHTLMSYIISVLFYAASAAVYAQEGIIWRVWVNIAKRYSLRSRCQC
jgi:hypothetical protein